jgi:O-acetyl-ADP-ribose deacetylase (regulator of RNase III)
MVRIEIRTMGRSRMEDCKKQAEISAQIIEKEHLQGIIRKGPMKYRYHRTDIELIEADITTMNVDAIVNAANSLLAHGGGVAEAISRKGGPSIQEESHIWIKIRGEVSVGEAVITGAGNLPCRYVIHAVGPRMGEGDEDRKLTDATLNSLKTADSRSFKSIAFPAISTGIFGVPVDICATAMLSAVKSYLHEETGLERIVFCLFNPESLSTFQEIFFKLFQK